MIDSHQQHEQAALRLWHGGDRQQAVAQLEIALQLQPDHAEQWCRLGEFYDALASDAADQDAASTYREKAVAALTQAISLSPGLAKAHYALANVYRAQDICLALVEFEAAAKCDPQEYGETLAWAQKVVRDCTYRLADLNLIVLESAQEKPRAQILETEFYFEDRTIGSAVIHKCVSQGQRQFANFWLFESTNPDPDADQPVAQVAVSSTGNVSLSKGCPTNYQAMKAEVTTSGHARAPTLVASREAAADPPAQASIVTPASAPLPARRSTSVVWIPIGMVVVAVAGGLFAYFSLIAPAPNPSDKRADASSESPKAPAVQAATDPMPGVISLAPEPIPSAQADKLAPFQPQPSSQPRGGSSTARSLKAPPIQPRRTSEQTVARPARRDESVPTAVDAPIGFGATEAAAVEPKPPSRMEQSAAAPSVQKEQSAAANSWLKRIRAELDVCGKPGIWRHDLCRERIRWNYCHPNRWDTVRECAVERFASRGVSD